MPKLDLSQIEPHIGSNYPAPFDTPCKARSGLRLSEAGEVTQFGANLMTLSPGAWSSQRHHHSTEDEIVMIISGHPTLYESSTGVPLSPGDVTVHPMGNGIGHHMKNETDADVIYLVVGGRNPETDSAVYPDIDLDLPANGTPDRIYQHKDGTPY
ncbi:transcriptional regulator [Litorimonas cladophorae]|uniref:Transcriptional regulator n=1 Tax=Litorimonas cladophorae TaxID=1220491 RepID=A0A918KRW5_9PROT|nr:cupin domain-containing protein [Litorimonas cladophorae]GGX73398.1 transcriptional regulator [Litorimonas cladophorae]